MTLKSVMPITAYRNVDALLNIVLPIIAVRSVWIKSFGSSKGIEGGLG